MRDLDQARQERTAQPVSPGASTKNGAKCGLPNVFPASAGETEGLAPQSIALTTIFGLERIKCDCPEVAMIGNRDPHECMLGREGLGMNESLIQALMGYVGA